MWINPPVMTFIWVGTIYGCHIEATDKLYDINDIEISPVIQTILLGRGGGGGGGLRCR